MLLSILEIVFLKMIMVTERPNQGAQYVREDQSTSERTYARTLKPPSVGDICHETCK